MCAFFRGQGPSTQMSVLNVYQAVRSLLHFSQVTAWYMSTNGTKPANVIYRVVIPEDATYIADDDFIRHDLPVAEINKAVTMKVSCGVESGDTQSLDFEPRTNECVLFHCRSH